MGSQEKIASEINWPLAVPKVSKYIYTTVSSWCLLSALLNWSKLVIMWLYLCIVLYVKKMSVVGGSSINTITFFAISNAKKSKGVTDVAGSSWRPVHVFFYNFSDNHVPQWWVELDDELSWLFTNRLSATK